MLLLAIGDIHIPYRAIDFPDEFKKLLLPGKIQQVLCLGNSTSSIGTLEFLKSLSPDLQIVKGAYDLDPKLPLSSVVQHDQLRIGFLNGFNIVPKNDPLSLLIEARKMDVDILIWGGTHRVEAYTLDNKLFINPGSATGAFTTEELSDDEDDYDTQEESAQPADNKDESNEKNIVDSKNDNPSSEDLKKEDLLSKQDEEDVLVESIPSFCLLDIQGSVCTLYIYTYIDSEVKVDKVTYRKD